LDVSAGKEDPVELDSSVMRFSARAGVARWELHNVNWAAPVKDHCRALCFTNAVINSVLHQMGSLAGAAHLLDNNADVLRLARCGLKARFEYKGKSQPDDALLCVSERNLGLTIPL